MKYHVKGEIEIRYTWWVDQEIEAESEDDAIDAVCEDLDPSDSLTSDTNTYRLDVDKIEEREETEFERMRRLGAPMLPGFA
jgi:hypothetical protein